MNPRSAKPSGCAIAATLATIVLVVSALRSSFRSDIKRGGKDTAVTEKKATRRRPNGGGLVRIELTPLQRKRVDANVNRGNEKLRSGDVEGAARNYLSALRIDPRNDTTRKKLEQIVTQHPELRIRIPAAHEPSRGMQGGYSYVRIPAGDGVDCFDLGSHEVSVTQFQQFVEDTGYKTSVESRAGLLGDLTGLADWRHGGDAKKPAPGNHPVVNVSPEDAEAFCKWIGGRLPTLAEWKHAARAGRTDSEFVWGNSWPPPPGSGNLPDSTARARHSDWTIIEGYDDGFAETAPIGSFTPNGYGLSDMAGNVWEWVAGKPYCCGGSFYDSGRLALRLADGERVGKPQFDIGFRVARNRQD